MENDKWLENALKKAPKIDQNDDFMANLQNKIAQQYSPMENRRRLILFISYLSSILILLLSSPWQLLTSWLKISYGDIINIFSQTAGTQIPIIAFAIIFIISITVYLIGQESFD